AIHLSKNRRRSSAAKMLYASFAFSCQQLFSKFFQEALQHPALPCPAGLSRSRCASARFRVMPKTPHSVKHFFSSFLKKVLPTVRMVTKSLEKVGYFFIRQASFLLKYALTKAFFRIPASGRAFRYLLLYNFKDGDYLFLRHQLG
ncbi:MAG: hypothetical protein IJY48_03910, partial [Mailhella sp.]|nr:hypothetical protein [Mailhella sp.]